MTQRTDSRLKPRVLALLAAILALGMAACSSGGDNTSEQNTHASQSGTATTAAALQPKRGGSVVDLLGTAFAGSWPSGLDPATNTTSGSNLPQNQAIFGGLFLLRADKDGSNARIVGNQAESGTLSPDAMTLTIKLRPGIKFSDGTPFDAKAVIWNFKRDSQSSCTCAPQWQLRKKDPFTSPDPLTVKVHFSQPNAVMLHNFPIRNVNWIASPTAYKKMGEKAFKIKPVGAGPFTVVSNKLSSTLVVKANPNYFKDGLPYLDKITFQSISGDQEAYQALLAGQADAYEGASVPSIIKQAQSSPKLQVTVQPGTSPYMVQVNTMAPPFNKLKAREAIYYATDWEAINKGIFGGTKTIVQSFTTPADLYYHKTVPGYRTYDLDKAKKIIQELGGLSFELTVIANPIAKRVATALQTQFERAGMDVTLKTYQLNGIIKQYNSGKWKLALQKVGSWDPGAGLTGVTSWFRSNAPLSGTNDPKLDAMLDKALSKPDDEFRDQAYQEIAKYLSDHAYGTFGFAGGQSEFAVKGLHAPGLTTKIPALAVLSGVIWGEAWTENR